MCPRPRGTRDHEFLTTQHCNKLRRVSSSIQSKVRCAECDTWHMCPVCPGPHSTPGKGLDRPRSQENPYLDP